MNQSTAGFFFSLLFLFPFVAASAGNSAYFRARGLVEEDPIEADALLAAVIANTESDKIRRAAAYDLFYLRLKNGRLAEAFPLARSTALRKKYQEALVEGLQLSEKTAARLMSVLRQECHSSGDVAEVAKVIHLNQVPVSVFDFAIRVLMNCKVSDPQAILPDDILTTEPADKKQFNLVLYAIRLALNRDDTETAELYLENLRSTKKELLEKEKSYPLQIALAEARFAAKKGDFIVLYERCDEIESAKPAARTRDACRFLAAYGLLKEKKHAKAFAKIASVKIDPRETDNRLLRLTAAVASGKADPEKLRKFMRRASYKDSAKMLKDLAASVLSEYE